MARSTTGESTAIVVDQLYIVCWSQTQTHSSAQVITGSAVESLIKNTNVPRIEVRMFSPRKQK